ncbi:uncharacterized mitochondrial protein-like protein [Tanacetum coccineum]
MIHVIVVGIEASKVVSEKEGYATSTNRVSTVSPSVSAARQSFDNPDDLSTNPLMPDLEDTTDLLNTSIFSGAYDDEDEGTVVDLNNLETTINVSPIPTTRIHKDHPKDQIIGDINSTTQTRRMTKISEEHALKVIQALDDPSWIEAMQQEVYVCQPPGFEDPQFPDKVYKVEKALYGLHQAPKAWQRTSNMRTNKALLKDEEAEDVDVHLYRSMIGSLMYLTASRPGIMFAVCACIRFQVTPKVSHLYAVKMIFRYLKGQPKLGLWYPRDSPFDLEAFSDSDYAGASLDRKSTKRAANDEIQVSTVGLPYYRADLKADSEEDDDEDPEEDPVDYPANGGDDRDDEDEPSEEDEDDDVDIEADEDEEEEEHLAPTDSVVVALPSVDHAPSAEETEPFETDKSAAMPPPHPAYRVTARIFIPAPVHVLAWSDSEIPSPPLPSIPCPSLPVSPLLPVSSPVPVLSPSPPASPIRSLGYRAAMIWLRAEAASNSHSLPLLPPFILSHTRPAAPSSGTPPLHLLFIDRREDRPEVTLPPQKRLGIALGPAYEARESSSAAAARPAGGLRVDYGFVATKDREIRRDPKREVGYGITDSWDIGSYIMKILSRVSLLVT